MGRRVTVFLWGRAICSSYYLYTKEVNDVTGFYHSLVVQVEDMTYIVPYRTSNGTYVNGEPVLDLCPHLLQSRDIVTFGSDGTLTINGHDTRNPFTFVYFRLTQSLYNAALHPTRNTPSAEVVDKMIGETSGTSQNDTNCPVCHDTFEDPYTTSCGHTACHTCLVRWKQTLKERKSAFTCPVCRNAIGSRLMYPNLWLRNHIDSLKNN